MANRSITVTLRANVQDFKSQFDAATRAAEQTAKATEQSAQRADTAMGRMVQSAQDNRQAWDQAGGALTAFGAATLGGLGLATKAAMDWESAWAGVQKTVDGTAPQMAALEEGLRGLARELPASHAEIAAVAEAAGQLGIATPNVLSFTRTMIDMGEATNMSADQAATSLSRFMNITQTSQSDVGRLGAAVVGLGNNFATTESEIVDMSMRIAGAGEQAGLTEGEIFGMATALSSVGIEAEAGGTAISRTMKRIGMEVDTGGDKLDMFAQVAGMSAEQFSAAWREDPAAAMEAFVTGLANTEQLGMSTNQVLSELGITAIRESDSLLRLSAAGDVLGEAMAMGNAEFEKGTALIEEASKRYETAESRIRMAGNAIVDSGISIGSVFLPVVADVADRVAVLAGAFADLPAPVQGAVGALGGLAGAAALGAGSFLLLFPRVMDTVSAFRDLREISPRAASAVGRVGKAVGIAGAAFAAVGALNAYGDSLNDVALGANETAAAVDELAKGTDPIATLFDGMSTGSKAASASTQQLADDLDILANGHWYEGISNLETNIRNVFGAGLDTTDDLRQRLEEIGQGFAVLAKTDLPAAQDAFTNLWEEFGGTDEAGQNLLKTMPALRDELIGIASAAGIATDDATLLKILTGEITPVMDEASGAAAGFEKGLSGVEQAAADAATATGDYYDSLRQLADEFITAERAAMDYADSLEETAKAAAENGKAWEDGTEAADANKRALLDLAEQALATADSLSAEGKSGTFLQQAREDLIDVATEMTGSRELAEEYVDQLLGTPEEISTIVELETEQAKADWAALWDELGYNPPEVPVGADTQPAEDEVVLFQGSVTSGDPSLAPVGADTSGAQEDVEIWGSQVGDVPAKVYVQADLYGMEATMEAFYAEMQDQDWTVDINGETVGASEALDILLEEVNAGDGSVTINGITFPADTSLMALIEAINMSDGTVTIEGNNKPANRETDAAKRHADGTTGTIDVDANTAGAESSINHTARDRGSYINVSHNASSASSAISNAARDRSSRIYVRYSVVGGTPQVNFGTGRVATARAGGGPVFGPGTETSDSIDARLSHNEHVWAAREVKAVGGHMRLANIRSQVLAGAKTIRLATGGAADGSVRAVQSMPYMPASSSQSVSASVDTGAIAAAVRAGMEDARVIAQVSDRVAANLHQRGRSASRAFGGAR